ncbi:hypothetical protein LT493_11870 [Streptomyces tricolor]|nr:hypothetical protein [Streptomyces tricolor]
MVISGSRVSWPCGQASSSSSVPHTVQCGCPIRAYTTRSRSYTSVTVPTVDRGLREAEERWSTATAEHRPPMWSTSGLSIWCMNCRAKVDMLCSWRRWPSA